MKNINNKYLSLFFSLCLVCWASGQDTGPLEGSMEAYKLVQDEEGNYQRYRTEETKPGEMLEYVIRYLNVSDASIGDIEIVSPIPQETTLVSRTLRSRKVEKLQVSIDGGFTYQEPPILKRVRRGNRIVTVKIPESRWTHLKLFVSRLDPGEYAGAVYRVVVK